MTRHGVEIVVFFILLVTIGSLITLNKILSAAQVFRYCQPEYCWLMRASQNIIGYLTVFLPGYFIHKYIRKIDYLSKASGGRFSVVIRTCFGHEELVEWTASGTNQQLPRTLMKDGLLLLFYVVGLQSSFLTWGVLQEKVMTQNYTDVHTNAVAHFTDSQFLVFVNRVLAFIISGITILCTRQPRHKAPMYKYVFCSFSNILSSWCQYEALKYVSFLHQVLAKAAKTIPVMIMGKIVSRTKYDYYEYVSALILSMGMLLFMIDTSENHIGSSVTTFSGIILLFSYIIFDSFTSNWQGALFKQFGMSPVQMMCAVNFFSCIFTAVSLLQQGGFDTSISFMIQYPAFIFDCLMLSICSAVGQLFIFKTISTFGPLVFAIITTVRQGFSVLLSCIIYKHSIHLLGVSGVFLVFFSVFLRIYCGYKVRLRKKHSQNSSNLKM